MKDVTFGPEYIEKMRKDVLTLAKNVDRVEAADSADYAKLRAGVHRWATWFSDAMYEDFIPHLEYSVRIHETGSDKYNEYFQPRIKKWADYWEKKLRKDTWDLYISLIGFPEPNRWVSEKKQWADKVRREARGAWKVLTEYLDWLKGADVSPIRKERPVEKVRLEGFAVTVIGYDPDSDYSAKAMELFKEGLRFYRKRAAAVFPSLLKRQLPIEFRFDCRLDLGGQYHGDHIIICSSGSNLPGDTAKILAHEMGHHLYKSISGPMEKFWAKAIQGDWGDLNLNDLLKVWPEGESLWDLSERLPDNDPVLALQLQGVLHGHSGVQSKPSWRTPEDLHTYLADGGDPIWTVPKHPITGYASKNAEEAFCETVGLAIAFGPQTLDPLIRSWMDTILPGEVKFASKLASRVLVRYLAATYT